MIEQLTDEERIAFFGTTAFAHDTRRKALRIIDAHAADRAALVAQLAAAERREKAANLDADHNGERAEAAEARVRELLALLDAQAAVITGSRAAEAECASHVQYTLRLSEEYTALRADVERLRTERKERDDMWHRRQENWRSSSARCLKDAESRLSAANALLGEMMNNPSLMAWPTGWADRVRAHIAAQPAMAPVRTEAEEVFGCVGCFP